MGFFIYSEVSLLFVVALLAATLKLRSLDSSLGHAVELVQGGVPGEGGLGQVRAVVVVQHLLLDGSHTAPEVLLQHNSTSGLGRLVGLLGALHAHLDYVAIKGSGGIFAMFSKEDTRKTGTVTKVEFDGKGKVIVDVKMLPFDNVEQFNGDQVEVIQK